MNENCCLCKCFTELYFFYWLLVVSLVILIAVPLVYIRSWTSLAGVNSKCPAYQTRFKITHRYKPLNKKINLINSFLCWSVTLLMFIQTLYHSSHCKFVKSAWEPAGRMGDFGYFFNGFAKSQGLIVLNIDWVQFVLKNCEILPSVRGLYDI